MVIINEPVDALIKLCGKQKLEGFDYKKLIYIQSVMCDEGLLVYNLMTKEFVLLQGNEIKAYENADFSNSAVLYLLENWFFVPKDFDDYKHFRQINTLFEILCDNVKNGELTQFTIFPTTDCNARCFYCFELACKRINMSKQTAEDVANYIIEKSCGKKVHITWFGGEPLYNSKAIDIITQGLIDAGVDYACDMVSNAYLFDKETVQKAKNFWKMTKIQITLDGTEEVYNKCKAYIYKNIPSPFVRVMDNIELLLENDIYVAIRLNIDLHNYSDLENLLSMLLKRFGKYKKLYIYLALLYDFEKKRTYETKKLLIDKVEKMNELIKKNTYNCHVGLNQFRTTKHCIADNNSAVTILPDGKLGKCEHFTDDNYIGSIYSDKLNNSLINDFKITSEIGTKCHKCSLQPKCYPLKKCVNATVECEDFDREYKIRDLHKRMLSEFELYKMKDTQLEDNSRDICS